MTGLPGNNSVASAITRALHRRDSVCLIYADLDNFKPFNDKYGFAPGDEIIKFTSSLLKKSIIEAGCQDAFVGHIGGDDFVLLIPSDKIETITSYIIAEFDRNIIKYYNEHDLQQGYISSVNRRGGKEEFPVMSISLAGVDLAQHSFTTYIEVNDACAEIKKISKSKPGSSFCLNQRSGIRK